MNKLNKPIDNRGACSQSEQGTQDKKTRCTNGACPDDAADSQLMLDDYDVFLQQELCIQDEEPYCNNRCPLGVDARSLLRNVAADKLESAFSTYRKRVIFGHILARICPAPCQEACLRGKSGDAVQIRMLEQACSEWGGDKAPPKAFIPQKDGIVHIVGGSLAGLSCANILLKKGFTVHIHEKDGRLGGRLWKYPSEQLPPEIIEKDIAQNTNFASLHIHLHEETVDLTQWEADSIIFVACTWASPLSDDIFYLETYLQDKASPVLAILAGKQAATHIEQRWKGEPPALWPEVLPTKLIVPHPDKEHSPQAVAPVSEAGYSRDEAVQEAARCFQCQCLECLDYCLLLKNGQGYPKLYINHAQQSLRTINHVHSKIAARRTNACNLCGLCAEICPNGLDMGEVYLKSRQIMHANGELPEAFHEFWLRDMAFSTSDQASLCRIEAGHEKASYLFFPGCQMGGSQPDYVIDTYRHLCQSLPGGVALSVNCCGAPSEWAGYVELTQPVIENFRRQWEALGQPQVILACPSCAKMFAKYHADMPVVSLWPLLAQYPPETMVPGHQMEVVVFDPCSSRYNPDEQQSIRSLLTRMDYAVGELPLHGRRAQCCGYGGLIYASNPDLALEIRADRIGESALPYVTYCVNCREIFSSGGKEVWHILDLLFAYPQRGLQKAPDWSTRIARRRQLKKTLLKEFWSEDMELIPAPYENLRLIIPDALSDRMEQELIMVDDIKELIYEAEQSGRKLVYDDGRFLAHRKLGYITYWAEYELGDAGIVLHNAYSHRMTLQEKTSHD